MICSLFRGRHVHLMGIGGAGVGALVPLLLEAGATVSGCDSDDSSALRRLRARGLRIAIGHDPAHVTDADLVVYTSAIGPDHPEIACARRRGIQVTTRGQCLVQLMQGARTLAVSGSHGKTSTTWMLGHLLTEAGADPVVMVGGGVASLGQGGARAGKSDLFVAETDESDGSFAHVSPEIAIVTNLDHEHLRHYGSFAGLEDAFNAWLRHIPAHGAAILPTGGMSARVTSGLTCRVITCGLTEGDYSATALELGADGSHCRVRAFGADIGELVVPIPGAHMVHNALMAVAAGRLVAPALDIGALARSPVANVSTDASPCTGSRAASVWSRTTATTRARCVRRSPPRASAAAGCMCCSNRTATRARPTASPTSFPLSTRRTRWPWRRSTPPARCPWMASHRRVWRRPSPRVGPASARMPGWSRTAPTSPSAPPSSPATRAWATPAWCLAPAMSGAGRSRY